jgi:hypothetical protein
MKALSVIELANLYRMNRQSIYKRINKGDLTKNSDGKIDLSEAIRVFGEPSQRHSQNVTKLQSTSVQKLAEVDILKQQVDILQKQLELAQDRERFQREQLQVKDDQIYSLQLLLGAPKAEEGNSSIDPIPETFQPETILGPKPLVTEQPQKKSGLLGRLLKAVLDDK